MKKFYSFFALLLICAVATNAAKIPSGTKLYLTPNTNWKTDNARYAAYFFGDGEAWGGMTAVSGEKDLYEVTTPGTGKNFTNVIFCRMNPSASANNWNNKWNQTSDLIYDGVNNHYTVKAGTWDKGGGTWSFYGVAEELVLGVSWSPDVVYPGDVVTISASATGEPEGSTIQITVAEQTTTGKTAEWVAGEAGDYKVKVACVDKNGKELANVEETIKVAAITSEWGVYLKKSSTTWAEVYVYAWDDFGTPAGAWPGSLTKVTNVDGDDYYYHIFRNVTSAGVIFSSGTEQTVDIANVTKDTYYELNAKNSEGKWTVKEIVVTGVENIEVEENVTPVYYNLQGIEVANPQNGIFIKKQGNKVSKVAL